MKDKYNYIISEKLRKNIVEAAPYIFFYSGILLHFLDHDIGMFCLAVAIFFKVGNLGMKEEEEEDE